MRDMWQNLTNIKFLYTRSYYDLVNICILIKRLRNNTVLAEVDVSSLGDYFKIKERKSNDFYLRALYELHRDGVINIHRLGGQKILLYVYPRFIPFLDLVTLKDPWIEISRKLGNIVYSAFDFSDTPDLEFMKYGMDYHDRYSSFT